VKEADLDTTKDDGDLAAGQVTGSNPGGAGETAVGSISFQAGSDDLVSFDFAAPTGITVTDEDGNAIDVEWSIDGSGQLVGTIGSAVAIVLAVNGSAIAAGATGTVTVTATLTDRFPHADGAGNVSIGGIQVVATDTDGTQATATIGVSVSDDVPSAENVSHEAVLDDEGQPLGLANGPGDANGKESVASGQLAFNAGADGLKSIEVTGLTVLGADGAPVTLKAIYVDPVTQVGTQHDVTLTWTQNGVGGAFVGTIKVPGAGEKTAFTLEIGANGAYELTLSLPLAHPFTDPDSQNNGLETSWEDDLRLSFEYKVTDGDNDTASAHLDFVVNDDSPTFVDTGSVTAANGPGTHEGELGFSSGADGWSEIKIDAPGGDLTYDGQPLQYQQVGNTLIAYTTDVNDPVFKLTVEPGSNKYVFEQLKALDGETSSVGIGGATSFGAGPSVNGYILTEKGSGEPLAIVSAWTNGGTKVANTFGSHQGWGVNNGNMGKGEMLRFDFGAANDFDGAGVYNPPSDFNGATVSQATFNFTQSGASLNYVVHYTDGTTSNGTINASSKDYAFTLPPSSTGKFIDYIEIEHVSGKQGKLSLDSVDRVNSTIDVDLDFNVTITDGDGDAVTGTIHVGIKDTAPTLAMPAVGGDGTVVDESALTGGTHEGSGGNVTTGSFSYASNDGGVTLKVGNATLISNGVAVFTLGGTIAGQYGVLEITSIDLVSGTISYKYTLTDRTEHSAPGKIGTDDQVLEHFAVSVEDKDGDLAKGTLDIAINDDGPAAVDDAIAQNTENQPVIVDVLANDAKGADGVNLAKGITVVANSLSGAGTLVYNKDGTFTYKPAPGEQGTVTFRYQIKDADGDTSVATVTITLQDDSEPTVGVVRADGDDGVVWESALPGGSGGGNLTEAGTLTINTGNDTLAFVEVQDKNGAWVKITADGTIVQGVYGTLSVDMNGDWTYALAANTTDHGEVGKTGGDDQVADAFAVRVTDSDGDTSDGTAQIVVQINDDGPVAVNDPALTAEEGGAQIGGNVLANDKVGADGASLTSVTIGGTEHPVIATGTTTVTTPSGVYTFLANGVWTFTPASNLNNASDLDAGFSYRITDGDGDTSTAAQPITVTDGTGPTAVGSGPVLTVKEADLDKNQAGSDLAAGHVTGSNPGGTGETHAESITFQAGSDDLVSFGFADPSMAGNAITVKDENGDTIAVTWTIDGSGQLVGKIGGSVAIVLAVSGNAIAAGAQGTVTVTATLTDHFPHANGGSGNVNIGGIQVVATDTDGTQASATIGVTVVDDVPHFGVETSVELTNTEDATAHGDTGLVPGADDLGSLKISGIDLPAGWIASPTGGSNIQIFAPNSSDPVFVVTLHDDGTYDVTQLSERPGSTITTEIKDLADTISNSPKASYSLEDGFITLTALTNVNGQKAFNANTFGNNGHAFGIGNPYFDAGEKFNIGFKEAVSSLKLDIAEVSKSGKIEIVLEDAAGNKVTIYKDINGSSSSLTVTEADLLANNNNQPFEFVSATLTGTNGIKVQFLNLSYVYTESHPATDMDFTVHVQAIDGDGDHASTTIHITSLGSSSAHSSDFMAAESINADQSNLHSDSAINILGQTDLLDGSLGEHIVGSNHDDLQTGDSVDNILHGGAGNDILIGGAGNDTLIGGDGNDLLIGGPGQDTLTGGAGADTFKLDSLDINDLITDYSGTEGDVIDLTSLFSTNGEDISHFVKYDQSTGVLSVDKDGAANGSNFVDVATLQNTPVASTITLLYDDDKHTTAPSEG